ncbi:hypothetical protein V1506DRAFT_550214 [Lipomyces tetrasporus]
MHLLYLAGFYLVLVAVCGRITAFDLDNAAEDGLRYDACRNGVSQNGSTMDWCKFYAGNFTGFIQKYEQCGPGFRHGKCRDGDNLIIAGVPGSEFEKRGPWYQILKAVANNGADIISNVGDLVTSCWALAAPAVWYTSWPCWKSVLSTLAVTASLIFAIYEGVKGVEKRDASTDYSTYYANMAVEGLNRTYPGTVSMGEIWRSVGLESMRKRDGLEYKAMFDIVYEDGPSAGVYTVGIPDDDSYGLTVSTKRYQPRNITERSYDEYDKQHFDGNWGAKFSYCHPHGSSESLNIQYDWDGVWAQMSTLTDSWGHTYWHTDYAMVDMNHYTTGYPGGGYRTLIANGKLIVETVAFQTNFEGCDSNVFSSIAR